MIRVGTCDVDLSKTTLDSFYTTGSNIKKVFLFEYSNSDMGGVIRTIKLMPIIEKVTSYIGDTKNGYGHSVSDDAISNIEWFDDNISHDMSTVFLYENMRVSSNSNAQWIIGVNAKLNDDMTINFEIDRNGSVTNNNTEEYYRKVTSNDYNLGNCFYFDGEHYSIYNGYTKIIFDITHTPETILEWLNTFRYTFFLNNASYVLDKNGFINTSDSVFNSIINNYRKGILRILNRCGDDSYDAIVSGDYEYVVYRKDGLDIFYDNGISFLKEGDYVLCGLLPYNKFARIITNMDYSAVTLLMLTNEYVIEPTSVYKEIYNIINL